MPLAASQANGCLIRPPYPFVLPRPENGTDKSQFRRLPARLHNFKYMRASLSPAFVVLGMLFCTCLVTSNLLETKMFHVWGDINLTCGFIVFPISYILNDCIAEVWGFAKARFIIWVGFLMNAFVVVLGGIACVLPPITPGSDTAFREVFTFAPQVTAASAIAFLVGSFLNAWVMSVMKLADRDKPNPTRRFSLRAIASTIVGESADSLIFFPLAFYIFPLIFEGEPKVTPHILLSLMLTQVVAKTLYEVAALPLTVRVVRRVKRHEGGENFDENVSYNPLKIKDI